MNQPILGGPWRAVRKSVLALACATAVALTGLPALSGTAEAAGPLKPGKRCDELHGLKGSGIPPKGLPYGDASRSKALWDSYQYVNPAMAFDGLKPTNAQVKAAGKNYKKYTHNDPRRIYARFNNQKKWKKFTDYLTKQYIPNHGSDPRGEAFEKKVVKEMGLVGPDWICQKEVYFKDPTTGKRYKRVLDAYNKKTRDIVEIKSNGKPNPKQVPADRAWARHPGWRSYKYTFVFGENQTSEGRRFIKSMKRLAGADRVREYNYHSDHVPRAPKWAEKGPYRKNSPIMSIGNGVSTGSRGGGNDIIDQSPNTAKEWKEQKARIKAIDTNGRFAKGPGGVDFTTLDLRYIGKPVKGEGLNYAFSAKKLPDENDGGWGAQPKAQLISDAFFTWLALTPDKFWVNLNPDQPDRVMDDKFASTDAGRVLLEADLQMKHDFFKTMDPKTDLGKRFWASLPKENGRPCFAGIRNWIEPKTATVREQDGGIYILDTPLKLKSTPQDFATQPGGGEAICNPSKAQRRQAQAVIDRMIVPEVEKTINTAPQYADLRRVYTARVAAEWIRLQDAKSPTDYRKLINSNDVKRWPLRAPNQNWDKDALFKKYRKIFTEGEFRYNVDTAQGVMVYMVGGVDFSKQPKRNISSLRFQVEHRYAPRTAKIAADAMTDDADTDGLVMLGGNTAGKSTDETPPTTPTPSPTESSKPTTPGTPPASQTPTEAPSSPAPGNDQPSTPPGKDEGEGGLADTGAQVGLVSAIAAALLAAGFVLARVRRRRSMEN
ncbi:hypothetical protein [Streptomyces luteolus]|uniref:Gram-positive cocci surface proteins LPxTG domain-containing protein n=1 Tax=Streptomyces luteolus TaxID=3043615 RepID=A0ABT6SNX2_9ACTN|nr:hypothetical protein [Streptomyces sp. B-S-A12]MDI3417302.1 hypothetical protein [Streptomyces sp. B-S-A12]